MQKKTVFIIYDARALMEWQFLRDQMSYFPTVFDLDI